jgi:uncharacterized protein YgbK (DUF1537 family)
MRQNPLAVAIVADDLTGALDTAAPFASQGLGTCLTLSLDAVSRHIDAGAEVVALTTESRHCSAGDATHRVAAAFHALATLQPQIVFKKIDSMLRGNVGAEIAAAMLATNRRHAIITPAVPSQNRTMCSGTVYVKGERLPTLDGGSPEDTEMPRSAHLPELLQRVGGLNIHMTSRGRNPMLAGGPGLHAYVADAASEADLDTLAHFVIQLSREILPVGASGLGRALAHGLGANVPPPMPEVGSGVLLLVIGSRREVSGAQIAALRAAGADEIAVPVGPGANLDALLDLTSRQRATSLLVVRPESTDRAGISAREMAARLGRVAMGLVRQLRPSAIAMAGGDTAVACLASLEAERLHVLGELHDGIAFGTVLAGSSTMPFFTKSGSFGSQDTWIRLAALLRRRTS